MSRSPYDPSDHDFLRGPRPRLECGCGATFVREVAGQWQCRPCIGGYGSQPKSNDERIVKYQGYDCSPMVWEPEGETGPKRRARSAPLWTDVEVALLREHYPAGRIVRLLRLLRGRSREAIQTKAHAIGLRLDKSRELEGSRRSEMLKRAAAARREERGEWDGLVLEPAGEGGT